MLLFRSLCLIQTLFLTLTCLIINRKRYRKLPVSKGDKNYVWELITSDQYFLDLRER